MLRTCSKKVRENIRNYIMQDFDYIQERAKYHGITLDKSDTDAVIAFAYCIFRSEKSYEIIDNYGCANYPIFKDWASGLALGQLFCYYYNRSAVDDLGAILQETEAEKAKYTEEQAEELLTSLIYREMSICAYK